MCIMLFRLSKNVSCRIMVKLVLVILSLVWIFWNSVSEQEKYLREVYNNSGAEHFYNNDGPFVKEGYIAHGGGVGKFLYTNSKEAVCDSLQKGFQFIELDIIETDDGHLLAAHDRDYFCKLTGLPQGSSLKASDVKDLKINGEYSVLLGDDIYRIMLSNPDMILVTDKITNYSLLMEEIPLPDRIIIECFSPSGVVQAKKCGFIHTAYSLFVPSQLGFSSRIGMKLLIISESLFFDFPGMINQIQRLHKSGVCVMMYGGKCDDVSQIHHHLGKSMSKFYMGKYAPNHLPTRASVNPLIEKCSRPVDSQAAE